MVYIGRTSYTVTKPLKLYLNNRCTFHIKFWGVSLLILSIISLVFIVIFMNINKNKTTHNFCLSVTGFTKDNASSDPITEEFFGNREDLYLSKLGRILFLNEMYPSKRERSYQILVWKIGPYLERRHINYFTGIRHDPFEVCSVSNCNITYEENALSYSDAVVFHLSSLKDDDILKLTSKRSLQQRWIFLTDSSPLNTFSKKNNFNWTAFNGVFNWSMTYKMESDIPVPNGRTTPITKGILYQKNTNYKSEILSSIPNSQIKRSDVLIAVMLNTCFGEKMDLLNELKLYMDVDVYGTCAEPARKQVCLGYTNMDCEYMNAYKFYLVLEEFHCDQYLTDKMYWFAYTKGAIPIIFGPSTESCTKILPPGSFLNIDQYKNISELVKHVAKINETEDMFLKAHEWRRHFSVINENGYHFTRSMHYCRICEALNYNNEESKTYNDLTFYLDPNVNCQNMKNPIRYVKINGSQ